MTENTHASNLFVDDEPSILSALVRVVRDLNLDVHTAASAEDGLALLKQHNIDIVVSDKNMPGMGGSGFLHDYRPDTRRMMLTAYTQLA